MEVCDYQHEAICHMFSKCPFCVMKDGLEEEIENLKDQVYDLLEKIEELEK